MVKRKAGGDGEKVEDERLMKKKKFQADDPVADAGKKKKKRNKSKKKNSKETEKVLANGTHQSHGKQKEKKIHDPWKSIESGTAKSAATLRQLNGATDAESTPTNGPSMHRKQRLDKRKKRRGCDGIEGNVERPVWSFVPKPKDDDVLVVEGEKSSRRVIVEEAVDYQKDGVSYAKFSRKKRVTMHEEGGYIVEEPDEDGEEVVEKINSTINGHHGDGSSSGGSDVDETEGDEEDEDEEEIVVLDHRRRPIFDGRVKISRGDEDEEESDRNEFIDDEAEEVNYYRESEEDGVEEEESIDGEDEDEESLDGEEMEDEEFDSDDFEELEDSDEQSITSEESFEVAFEPDRKAKEIDTRPERKKGQQKLEIPIDFTQFPFNSSDDSTVAATKALGWILSNCGVQSFFEEFWQKNALVVHRHNKGYYGNLLNVKEFSRVVEKEHMEYGKSVNIAEYREGIRYTMNGEGRVYPRHLQNHLMEGRSVQLVNPQRFFPKVWYICETLQELFGCFVGANTYLTPAGSSGFAPHWDEIDAFLLQLEGRKYWKVYAPDCVDNELPRESSGNFTDKDFAGRQPCFEGWLEQGDMLYLPRGFVHQASTCKQVHSFHVTISVGRQHSFADMMEKLMPIALAQLGETRVKLRQGLPPGYLDMTGVADLHYKNEEHEGEKLTLPITGHMSAFYRNVRQAVPVAVDLMAREFMKTALPPMLTPEETRLSAFGAVDILGGKRVVFSDRSQVRLIRRHAQRLIFESDEACFIVHRMTNSLDYEGRPEQLFSLPIKLVKHFCSLESAYPEWTCLGELGSTKRQKKKKNEGMIGKEAFEVARILYDNGLLMVKED